MLTAKYIDTEEILDITKIPDPRKALDKQRLVCKHCNGSVSIRHGLIRAKHFYHLSPCTSDFASHPESAEHNLAKELIAGHVKAAWSEYSDAKVVYEYAIPEIRRIADVAMLFPNGWIVVHEIQLASITTENLQLRTDDYNKAGIDTIWWLGKTADSAANRAWSIKNYGYSLSIDYEVLEERAKSLQTR